MASGGNVANSKNSALLLPNWFDDAAEYRLKKSLVRDQDERRHNAYLRYPSISAAVALIPSS